MRWVILGIDATVGIVGYVAYVVWQLRQHGEPKNVVPLRPTTYEPTPDDAPLVCIHDLKTDQRWLGVLHDGLVHDASGVICPFDIGWRFDVYDEHGKDLYDLLAMEDPHDLQTNV